MGKRGRYIRCCLGDTGLSEDEVYSRLKYRMYPVEVKSGTHYSATFLIRFREKYRPRIGECHIIVPRNLSIKDRIICIPPYMTMCL